jgi:hypothetical protein
VLAWYNLILIPAWYMDRYYIKSLAASAGIKLVPDLSHKKLVLYLIPVLISVSDPIYQTNTGSYIGRVSPGDRGFYSIALPRWNPLCTSVVSEWVSSGVVHWWVVDWHKILLTAHCFNHAFEQLGKRDTWSLLICWPCLLPRQGYCV